MATYGYEVIERVGRSIQVSADGNPMQKAGGITIAWETITAAVADYEVRPAGETISTNFLSNNSPADDYVYAGQKFARYGTVMCRIVGGTYAGKFAPYGTASGSLAGGTLSKNRGDVYILNQSVNKDDANSDHGGEAIDGGLCWKYRILANWNNVQTITMTATGGTFTVSYKGQATAAQAYNVAAATLQTALEGLSTIGAGKVTVALSSGVYTITLANSLGVPEAFVLGVGSLTGGSATLSTAADTAAGPTKSEFETMFPSVRLVND